ncbi:MAG: leucine-rich repeat domain-containing protein [Lachnospiraceae bacterium]|nr:leucine-rich repeat domain-containing protein [Lachnospiraceae bacterium]
MKKIIIRTAVLMLLLGISYGVAAKPAQASKTTRSSRVKVTLKKGVLTISGKGAMPADLKVKNKRKVKKIIIKKGVTTISDFAFHNYKNLKSVTIPSTVKKIGWESFYGTAVKSVKVPSTVTSIGQCAFWNCRKLKKITLPGDFSLRTKSGDDAEYELAGSVDTVVYNTKLKLANTAVMTTNNFVVDKNDPSYKSIHGVIYSKDGKSIVRVPFARKKVVLEEGCEEFCLQSVLYCNMDWESDVTGCCAVETIVIPASVKKVEAKKYFSTASSPLETKPMVEIKAKQFDGASLSALVYDLGITAKEVMRQLPEQITLHNNMYISWDGVLLEANGNNAEVKVPQGVKKIGNGTFEDKEEVTKVTLPEGVTEIGEYAFASYDPERKALQINLPSTLVKVGDRAFYGCNIKKLEIPASLRSFGKYAFAGNDFTEVVLPDGLETIPEGLFQNCAYLKNMVIPASVKTIEAVAFGGLDGESRSRKFMIQGTSKKIADDAFSCPTDTLTYTGGTKEMKSRLDVWYFASKKGKKAKVKIRWNKVTGADGYQVTLSGDAKFRKNKTPLSLKKGKQTATLNISWKNKKAKAVYGRIRPYKIVKGKKIYGRWSRTKLEFY